MRSSLAKGPARALEIAEFLIGNSELLIVVVRTGVAVSSGSFSAREHGSAFPDGRTSLSSQYLGILGSVVILATYLDVS